MVSERFQRPFQTWRPRLCGRLYFHPLIICLLLETENPANNLFGVSPGHTPSEQIQNGSICPAFVAGYGFAFKLTAALSSFRLTGEFPYDNVPILG